MSQENSIEVINAMGWSKKFVLDKPIIQIGKDSRNDIVLDDGSENTIAGRHAQLLPSSVNSQGMRLVNMSNNEITVVPYNAGPSNAGTAVAPRAAKEIASGDKIKIGGFTLLFEGGTRRSGIVELAVNLSDNNLEMDRPLTGTLSIRHIGDRAAVQFRVEIEGLDAEFYELGPGPVLFPNAEKQVSFRLVHPKRALPPAGTHRITFHVSAPDAYPGEEATISQDIRIAPFFLHKIRIMVMDSRDYLLA